MRPSLFQTAVADDVIRCDVCAWHCRLAPDEVGRCRVRRHVAGSVECEADALVSAATIEPIEEQRLWHFFPDAQMLNIGSYGTPLQVLPRSYALLPGSTPRQLKAERVVEVALEQLCRGVIWTYNDPAVTLEWTLEGMKLARAASRVTALTSSGYFSTAAVAALGPYLDGLRLDLLGWSDTAYMQLGGLPEWHAILEGAEELRAKWNTHIEVMLELHAGINDDEQQIEGLCRWIVEKLGRRTPLHISVGSNGAAWERVAAIASAVGIDYVYGPELRQATCCPRCEAVLIEREPKLTNIVGIDQDRCARCGAAVGLRNSVFQRQTRPRLDT
jgi:pyruvate formate lyase activating enzyme